MNTKIEYNDEIIRWIVNNINSSDGRYLEDIEKYKLIIKFLDENNLTTRKVNSL